MLTNKIKKIVEIIESFDMVAQCMNASDYIIKNKFINGGKNEQR